MRKIESKDKSAYILAKRRVSVFNLSVMATRVQGMGIAQSLIPIFKGENYEFLSIRMKTLLLSQDLWDFVEYGYVEPDKETTQ